ncbi:MAG: ROK family protein [Candidatus Promineifilaceae bacterium]|nr:ROK family protein [Candidatus Promineifilaceae bacterium]
MVVGLDIGGTKTAVLVVDQAMNILSRYTSRTEVADPQLFLESIISAIRCSLEIAGQSTGDIRAIGVGLPGRVIPETGEVASAVNLNLDQFPIGDALAASYNVPVIVENDVRAAAVGLYEQKFKQQAINHMAYLSIGTGISAGIVLNGTLYRGASGMAGEIGHVMFQPEGRRCLCGAHGCLEALASGPAIAQQWHEKKHHSFSGELTAKHVFEAANTGEPAATKIIKQAGKHIARAIQMLIMLYDVDTVVLGGGVTGAGRAFLDPVLSALSRIRSESKLAKEMLPESKVEMLPYGTDAPTLGAVKLALQAVT